MTRLGGDPQRDQPARAGRTGHRPLGAGRRLRHGRCARRRTTRSSSSATASATRSCAGARRRSATSASCRRTPASSTRSTSSTWRASCSPTTRTAAKRAYPDTLVGTDSHTTMINGLGVLGWGVGGIEAEAAMLGQPVTMLIPQVIGFQLTGALPAGATATDLVLTVTEMLRKKGVVDKFVEFFGDGLAGLPLADRATIANMAPEYGAPAASSRSTRRRSATCDSPAAPTEQIALVEAYAKAQGLWRTNGMPRGRLHRRARARPRARSSRASRARSARRTASRCSDVEGSLPQARSRRWPTSARRRTRRRPARRSATAGGKSFERQGRRGGDRRHHQLHEHLEPGVLIARRPARAQGAQARPQRRSRGSRRASRRARASSPTTCEGAGLLERPRGRRLLPRRLRLHDLHRQLRPAAARDRRGGQGRRRRSRRSVLSGNRNFEGRVHPRSEDELPRLAAARRRLRARGHAGHRPQHRAARHRHATASRSS